MAQIKKGVDYVYFPIRRIKENLAMLMIQVTLNLDDVMKMFVQVIKMLDEYSYANFRVKRHPNNAQYFTIVVKYVLETRGEKSCRDGFAISSSLECTEACDALEKNYVQLKNGRLCYVAGNGRTCKQDGRHGAKASLICKGNRTIYTRK